MDKVNLYIDVDDTITKSSKLVLDILNSSRNTNFTEDDIYKYCLLDLFPNITHTEILNMFDSQEFYENVETFENCLDIINSYRDNEFYKMNIVTVGTDINFENKVNWIMDNIHGEIYIRHIPHGYGKDIVDMSNGIQIDDHLKYLRQTNAKIKILYKDYKDRECNQIEPNEEIYVVNNWNEIDDILKFYERMGGII